MDAENNALIPQSLVADISHIIQKAKNNVSYAVNSEIIAAYHQIGKLLVQNNIEEKQSMLELSKQLTRLFGGGFSRSNLFMMKKFYATYADKTVQTLSVLSWSHYCELLSVSDNNARQFYETECSKNHWSVRELRRQIETSFFERILLVQGNDAKKKTYELAQNGIVVQQPVDIMKEPFVLDFLNFPSNTPILEKDLENAIAQHLEQFLLELGKGFMYVGRQKRMMIGNTWYFVDMMFYNKILKSYVLIDLKLGSLKPEHIGQMNAYLNYCKTEINDEDDNAPIGIILCADKSEIVAEYALGEINNTIFAGKCVPYIPDKAQLVEQVQRVLKAYEK